MKTVNGEMEDGTMLKTRKTEMRWKDVALTILALVLGLCCCLGAAYGEGEDGGAAPSGTSITSNSVNVPAVNAVFDDDADLGNPQNTVSVPEYTLQYKQANGSWAPVTDKALLANGTPLQLSFSFALTQDFTNKYTVGKEYYIHFQSSLPITAGMSKTKYDGQKEMYTYTLDGAQSTLSITFTDYIKTYLNNVGEGDRAIIIFFTGEFSETGDGGKKEYSFGGEPFYVYRKPEITVVKTAEQIYQGTDGFFYADFVLTMTSDTDLTGENHVTDTFGSLLIEPKGFTLDGAPVSVTDGGSRQYQIPVGQIAAGQTKTLRYTAKLNITNETLDSFKADHADVNDNRAKLSWKVSDNSHEWETEADPIYIRFSAAGVKLRKDIWSALNPADRAFNDPIATWKTSGVDIKRDDDGYYEQYKIVFNVPYAAQSVEIADTIDAVFDPDSIRLLGVTYKGPSDQGFSDYGAQLSSTTGEATPNDDHFTVTMTPAGGDRLPVGDYSVFFRVYVDSNEAVVRATRDAVNQAQAAVKVNDGLTLNSNPDSAATKLKSIAFHKDAVGSPRLETSGTDSYWYADWAIRDVYWSFDGRGVSIEDQLPAHFELVSLEVEYVKNAGSGSGIPKESLFANGASQSGEFVYTAPQGDTPGSFTYTPANVRAIKDRTCRLTFTTRVHAQYVRRSTQTFENHGTLNCDGVTRTDKASVTIQNEALRINKTPETQVAYKTAQNPGYWYANWTSTAKWNRSTPDGVVITDTLPEDFELVSAGIGTDAAAVDLYNGGTAAGGFVYTPGGPGEKAAFVYTLSNDEKILGTRTISYVARIPFAKVGGRTEFVNHIQIDVGGETADASANVVISYNNNGVEKEIVRQRGKVATLKDDPTDGKRYWHIHWKLLLTWNEARTDDVIVTDALPEGYELVSAGTTEAGNELYLDGAAAPGGGLVYENGTVSYTVPAALRPLGTCTIYLRTRVDAAHPSVQPAPDGKIYFTNSAILTGAGVGGTGSGEVITFDCKISKSLSGKEKIVRARDAANQERDYWYVNWDSTASWNIVSTRTATLTDTLPAHFELLTVQVDGQEKELRPAGADTPHVQDVAYWETDGSGVTTFTYQVPDDRMEEGTCTLAYATRVPVENAPAGVQHVNHIELACLISNQIYTVRENAQVTFAYNQNAMVKTLVRQNGGDFVLRNGDYVVRWSGNAVWAQNAQNVTLTDTLPPDFDLVSVTIRKPNGGDTLFSGAISALDPAAAGALGFTWSDAPDGQGCKQFAYAVPREFIYLGGCEMEYETVIPYDKVAAASVKTYLNAMVLDVDGDVKPDDASVAFDADAAMLAKACDSMSDEGVRQAMAAGALQWHSDLTLNAAYRANGFTFTDFVEAWQDDICYPFVKTGVSVSGYDETGTVIASYAQGADYTLAYSDKDGENAGVYPADTLMTLTMNGPISSQVKGIRISYSVAFDKQRVLAAYLAAAAGAKGFRVVNHCEVDAMSADAAWAPYINVGGYSVYKSGAVKSKDDHTVTWTISGSVPKIRDSFVLADRLPQGMAYVEGSVSGYLGGDVNKQLPLDVTQNGDTLQIKFENADGPGDGAAVYDSFTVTFDARVFSDTRPNNEHHFTPYTNGVTLYRQNTDEANRKGSAYFSVDWEYEANTILGKESATKDFNEMQYTVNINAAGAVLNNGKPLELKDTLHSDPVAYTINYTPRTARVTAPDGTPFREVASADLVTGNNTYSFDYNDNNRTLTLAVPDATPCVLTFMTTVTGQVGQGVNVENTVTLTGGYQGNVSQGITIQNASSTISFQHYDLRILKSDQDNRALKNATFTIAQVDWENPAAQTVIGSGKTDDNGMLTLPTNRWLAPDTLYCLRETPPTGYTYASGDGTKFFVLLGRDQLHTRQKIAQLSGIAVEVFPQNTQTTLTIQMSIRNEQIQDSFISYTMEKRWEGDDGQNRPAVNLILHQVVLDAQGSRILETDQVVETVAVDVTQNPFSYTRQNLYAKVPSEVGTASQKPYVGYLYEYYIEEDAQNLSRYYSNVTGNVAWNVYAYPEFQVVKRFEENDSVPADQRVTFRLTGGTVARDITLTKGVPLIITGDPAKSGAGEYLYVDGLSFGQTYTLTENPASMPRGYQPMEFAFTLTKGANKTIVTGFTDTADVTLSHNDHGDIVTPQFEATNRKQKKVTVRKIWVDDETDAQRIASATVRLTRRAAGSGAEYRPVPGDEYTQTLNTGNGNVYTWENLDPAYDYAVEELATDPADGYDASAPVTLKASPTEWEYSITNTKRKQPIKFFIRKTDANGENLPGATLRLTKENGDLFADGSAALEWESSQAQPLWTITGEHGTFVLEETKAPAHYLAAGRITFTVPENGPTDQTPITLAGAEDARLAGADTVAVINHPRLAEIRLSKTWLGSGPAALPSSVEVRLSRHRVVNGQIVPDNAWTQTVILSAGSAPAPWTAVVTGLAAADDQGVAYDYTALEAEAPGYTRTASQTIHVQGSYEWSFAFTNTRNDLYVLKVDQDGTALANAKLELYEGRGATGEPIASWTSTDQGAVRVSEHMTKAGAQALFVPGREYTLREVTPPKGYARANDQVFTYTAQMVAYAASNPLSYVTVENEQRVYQFRKADAQTDQALDDLNPATLAILKGDQVVDQWVTSGADNGWHTLRGTLESGQTYILREITAPRRYHKAADIVFSVNGQGYLVDGADPGVASTLLKITMKDQPASLRVEKKWADQENNLGKRPKSIQLVVERKLASEDDDAYRPCQDLPVYTMSGSDKSGTWTFTIYDLYLVDEQQRPYQYRAREIAVEGYDVSYEDSEGRTVITNTLKGQKPTPVPSNKPTPTVTVTPAPDDEPTPTPRITNTPNPNATATPVPAVTPTPTLPIVTPTPAPGDTPPAGVRFVNGEWVYIDENGVPLGLVPQTGDDTDWALLIAAVLAPLLLAGALVAEIRRRKRRQAIDAHRNEG